MLRSVPRYPLSRATLPVAALAATLCACFGNPPAKNGGNDAACRANDDCDPGYACADGHCRKVCGTDQDCPTLTQTCNGEQICEEVANPACTSDADCTTPPPCHSKAGATCLAGTCRFALLIADSPCEDGDFCTRNDRCDAAGTCAGVPDDGVCDAPPACHTATGATCQSGECHYPALPDTELCDDANQCTSSDHCDGLGACVGTPQLCDSPPANTCADGNATYVSYPSIGSCEPATGDCTYTPEQVPCADCVTTCLTACIGMVCSDLRGGCRTNGICIGGDPPLCDYDVADDLTRCDLADDGTSALVGWCLSAHCVECTTTEHCDDNDLCTTDTCTADNTCLHTTVPDACEDANPCTDDRCVPETGLCDHAANTAACGNCGTCSSKSCRPNAALCTGNCDVCTVAGNLATCRADPLACTGDCDACVMETETAWSCDAVPTLCGDATCSACNQTSPTSFSCSAAGNGTGCGSTNSCCNGRCINPNTDCEYCGGCATGESCGPSQYCAGGSCQSSCFAAGTPITLEDGSTRAIERVQVGDEVLSFDVLSGRVTPGRVTRVSAHPTRGTLLTLNGELRVTPNHLLWADGAWVPAGDLRPGAGLLELVGCGADDASPVPLAALLAETVELTTWDLEVAETHDYFAGGLLVHNKPPYCVETP